ncbi:hypothetical protein [Chryseobacterium camelliae]|uniref:hypothetical protein n=1 Tax=Chryseobacterium camelliae TaxID=1265445 RepID=UPI000C1CA6E1|nr:hypothetical protein [Chryseobacterium camelliae]
MNYLMPKAKMIAAAVFISALPNMYLAQEAAETSKKIEFTISTGSKTLSTPLRSASMQYYPSMGMQEPKAQAGSKTETKPAQYFYITMETEKLSPDFLKLLNQSRANFAATIKIAGPSGNKPERLIQCQEASLDTMSEQYTGDYDSSMISFTCRRLSVDGIQMN